MATHQPIADRSPRNGGASHTHENRRPRALVHASDGEIVLWCPVCRGQILRVRGQISVPRLAVSEVRHIAKCIPRSS